MKNILIAVAGVFISCGLADAKEIIFPPKDAGDVHYHKIEECPFERGIGSVWYKRVEGLLSGYVLTDLCFDRESGDLDAFDPVSNMTLVQDADDHQSFEDLHSQTSASVRSNIYVSKFVESDWPQRTANISFSNYGHEIKSQNFPSLERPYISGRLITDIVSGGTFNQPLTFYIYIHDTFENISADLGISRRDGERPFHAIGGIADFNGGQATVELKPAQDNPAKGSGRLQIWIDEAGAVTGTGTFNTENSRLAGHKPEDWKSTEWEIIQISGFGLGEGGEQIEAIGIAIGQSVAQDGHTKPAYGVVTISAYPTAWDNEN